MIIDTKRHQRLRQSTQSAATKALASHFGGGGTAQAVTERARSPTEKRALSVSLRSTALPKGEPRTQRKSPCLPLRGRWHPEGMTERARTRWKSPPPRPKKTKTDTFCRHKRKFHRNEKDVAKSLQKYCKIYYEIHQNLGSTLVQGAKKWNKIGRKEAQIPKSVHLDTCNLRIVSAIMGTSKGSQTRDCFRQKYNRRRIRLPLEDTRVRRPAATAFAHGRCTMKVSETKQNSWQNRSDPAAQS